MLHVAGIYWWYRNDDLFYPLVMLPPKATTPFWHTIFIVLVNGMYWKSMMLLILPIYRIVASVSVSIFIEGSNIFGDNENFGRTKVFFYLGKLMSYHNVKLCNLYL